MTDPQVPFKLTRYIKAELIATAVPANAWATTAVRQPVIFD